MEAYKPYDLRVMSAFDRFMIRVAERFTHLPKMTFDHSDINFDAVARLSDPKYKAHLEAVFDWMQLPDRRYLPRLQAAAVALRPLLRRNIHRKLYRGFNVGQMGQDTMGLVRDNQYQGNNIPELKVGDRFTYRSDWALSFTHFKGVAETYGSIVVSIDAQRYYKRLLPFTPELVYLMHTFGNMEDKLGFEYYFTYGEYLLLPSNEPVEFEVVAAGPMTKPAPTAAQAQRHWQ